MAKAQQTIDPSDKQTNRKDYVSLIAGTVAIIIGLVLLLDIALGLLLVTGGLLLVNKYFISKK